MNDKYLEAGKIVSTHGVRGEVKVLPWADSPEFLTRFKTFYLVKPSPSGEGVTAVKAVTDEGQSLPPRGKVSAQLTDEEQSLPPRGKVSAQLTDEGQSLPPRGKVSAQLTDEGLSGTRPLSVESSRVQKTCVLLKFRGVDTVEAAQTLRDKVIFIARNDPHIPAGTVFQADLIGMPVRAGGAEIGKIAEILSMPASDVWVVKGEREYMIPNVKAFVPKIDLSLGYVEVNLIEGMQTGAE